MEDKERRGTGVEETKEGTRSFSSRYACTGLSRSQLSRLLFPTAIRSRPFPSMRFARSDAEQLTRYRAAARSDAPKCHGDRGQILRIQLTDRTDRSRREAVAATDPYRQVTVLHRSPGERIRALNRAGEKQIGLGRVGRGVARIFLARVGTSVSARQANGTTSRR